MLLSFISIFVSGISFLEFQRIEVIKFGKICGIGVFKCIIIVYFFITQFDGKETYERFTETYSRIASIK